MYQFRGESWVRKVAGSYPRDWSTSGREYGDFHDPSNDLTWKGSGGKTSSVDPPRSWSPEGTPRSLYQSHFSHPRNHSPAGGYLYRNPKPKHGSQAFKPGHHHPPGNPHGPEKYLRLPPIPATHWVVKENQRHRHPHFHTSTARSSHELFDFKFRGAWKPFVNG